MKVLTLPHLRQGESGAGGPRLAGALLSHRGPRPGSPFSSAEGAEGIPGEEHSQHREQLMQRP